MAGARTLHSRAGPARFPLALFLAFMVQAAGAEVLVVQGQLTDVQGLPWNGPVPIEFGIYDSPVNGSRLWVEAQEVEVLDGLFSATLGDVLPFAEDLFATPDRWLGIAVDGAAGQAARFQLSSSPITIRAIAVESLSLGSVDGTQLERGALTPAKLQACNVGDIFVMGADGWVCKSPGD